MNWDYLKRWTHFRRLLSKRHVTPKINFRKNKEITQNSPETAYVCLFVISLTSSGHSNKSCNHFSTQKAIFIFLTSFFSFSALYEFLKSTATLLTFLTLYDVWNALWQFFSPLELRSCRLRPFGDVQRYVDMLICVYCKAWNSYAIKVKCSQLAL